MDLEPLLLPISPDAPCGEDLSYDAALQELDALVRGKEETQFSASEEPDWKAVRDRCVELFGRSKDLRVAVTLCLALLKIEGLAGLRDGLALLQRLLGEQWDGLYPRLDPDDSNDPMERVNIIGGMAKPLGTFGDPLRFLERLRQVPLAESPRIGRFSLAEITQIGLASGADKPAPKPAEVEAALRDTAPEKLAILGSAANEARTLLGEVDAQLMELVGSDRAPSLEELSTTLKEIQTTLRPYLAASASPVVAADDAGAPGLESTTGGQTGAGFSGAIRSRADVVRVLEGVCDYYASAEPASPVPLLLRRAQRLAEMDFMQLMQDLAPDALAQIGVIAGKTSTAAEEAPSE